MDKASYEVRIKQWISVIQAADSSGMSKCSWCEQHGIGRRKFYYWQKKVRDYVLARTLPPATDSQHDTKLSPAGNGMDLPVFCELTAPAEQSQLSPFSSQDTLNTAEEGFSSTFIPELILKCDHFQLLVGNAITKKTLSTVLSVLSHV